MSDFANKVCISHHCPWKHRCDLYYKWYADGNRQYIYPEQVAEACPYHVERAPSSWGQGAEPND